jgi:mannose-6-phosphate isomerase-like protein (cupin superfamily)
VGQRTFETRDRYLILISDAFAQEGIEDNMVIDLKTALSQLPLPATPTWPEGVWDKTVFLHGTMSVIIFTPRCHDYQTKHSQDELYIVIKGSGTLMIEGTPHMFCEGDVLFVPAEKQHRFVDFTDDLITWAIFWGPKGGESA